MDLKASSRLGVPQLINLARVDLPVFSVGSIQCCQYFLEVISSTIRMIVMQKVHIGYFIPEFPGQTHAFFWQERKVLSELGVQSDWLSTRCPPQGIISHIWASKAKQETLYLVPFTVFDWFNSLVEILHAGPGKWINCLSVIFLSPDTGLLEKFKLLTLIVFSGKLIWLWRKKDWDHIHVHSCGNAANIALFASILSGLTYSMTLHGPTLETYGNNQKQKWKHSTFALVVSDKLLNDVSVKLKGFLPKTVISVPMGVNLSEVSRKSQYTPWEEGAQCKLFACGRLNPIKGHSFLFKSVEILKNRGLDVSLKVAGEDEQGGQGYHKYLQELIQEMNLDDCIELLGAVSQERVRKLLGIQTALVQSTQKPCSKGFTEVSMQFRCSTA